MFQDIFDSAGEMRTVDLLKGSCIFTPILFLEQNLKIIEKTPESSFEEIVRKYAEMNIAHPFRDGNGRSTRIWLDSILKKKLSKCIDWQQINKNSYLQAMERSPINTLELKVLLKSALIENIFSREVYMKGIGRSYEYN